MATQNYIIEDLNNGAASTRPFNAPAFVNIQMFSNTDRPSAATYYAGMKVWNTDDAAFNYSDGTNWRDAMGNIT